MRSDTSLRSIKPPRGLVVSTGEEIPLGQSLRARMLVLEISPNDINTARLSACQADARSGQYAITTSHFIKWLAGGMDEIREVLRAEINELRDIAVTTTDHRRTPEIVANLAIGLRYFLLFAEDIGAISETQLHAFWQRGWAALGQGANRQTIHVLDNEPAARFVELITSALNTGRAHLLGPDGHQPPYAKLWGWCTDESNHESKAQGECIGFVDGDKIYLDPDASYRVALGVAGSSGHSLSITSQTLRKRLYEKGLIIRPEGREELTVRRIFRGRSERFLLLALGILRENPPIPPNPPSTSATGTTSASHNSGAPALAASQGGNGQPH